jgi:Domain of unknown function (DUF6916)
MPMLDHLDSRVFAEHLNTTFRLLVPGATTLPLELFEVSEKDLSTSVEQFSLIFRGPLTPSCPQGIYAVEHDKLGKFELFFVPLGPDLAGMRYQVIFCRMRGSKR